MDRNISTLQRLAPFHFPDNTNLPIIQILTFWDDLLQTPLQLFDDAIDTLAVSFRGGNETFRRVVKVMERWTLQPMKMALRASRIQLNTSKTHESLIHTQRGEYTG